MRVRLIPGVRRASRDYQGADEPSPAPCQNLFRLNVDLNLIPILDVRYSSRNHFDYRAVLVVPCFRFRVRVVDPTLVPDSLIADPTPGKREIFGRVHRRPLHFPEGVVWRSHGICVWADRDIQRRPIKRTKVKLQGFEKRDLHLDSAARVMVGWLGSNSVPTYHNATDSDPVLIHAVLVKRVFGNLRS